MSRRALGTCSVCFAAHVLTSRQRPVRHGFSIVGTRWGQGHSGAWHTGPCYGGDYPHLGISCEGTLVALGIARRQEESLVVSLSRLATRPTLRWTQEASRSRRGRTIETGAPVVHEVAPGTEADHGIGRPSYEHLLIERTREAEADLGRTRAAIATYERVIAEWSAERWPTAKAPAKVAVVHDQAIDRRTKRPVPACAARHGETSEDRAAVTCARCLTALAGADKRRAENAAVLHYAVMLPDGSIGRASNRDRSTKRPLVAVVAERLRWDCGAGAQGAWHVAEWCVSDAVAKREAKWRREMGIEVEIIPLEQPAE